MAMTVDYRFTSSPQRAVILEVSDGSRQLSVTEPLNGISQQNWDAFERSGFKHPGEFIASQQHLSDKLKQSEAILGETLRRIQTATNACDHPLGIVEYGQQLVARMRQTTPLPTSRIRKYTTTLRRFAAYLRSTGLPDLPLNRFDTTDVGEFSHHLESQKISTTSIGFYNRILAAIYNRAVAENLITDLHPFRNTPTYTITTAELGKTDSLIARQHTFEADIQRLIEADLTDPALCDARDILLLAYLTGLTLAQIIALPTGTITPQGLTTENTGIIPLCSEARSIFERHNEGDYYFYPSSTFKNGRRNPQVARNRYASAQKSLSILLGITPPLTITTARQLSQAPKQTKRTDIDIT